MFFLLIVIVTGIFKIELSALDALTSVTIDSMSLCICVAEKSALDDLTSVTSADMLEVISITAESIELDFISVTANVTPCDDITNNEELMLGLFVSVTIIDKFASISMLELFNDELLVSVTVNDKPPPPPIQMLGACQLFTLTL
tara:strand:- start:5471 stop:5902 length:432 start_codon:yes stop_codon:yes gene_type:complete